MAKEYLEAGQIVAFHGLKGEMRVKPWGDDASFLQQFSTVYFDSAGKEAVGVAGARAHGNVTLLKLEGYDSLDAAQRLKGKMLYIKKSDAALPAGSYFIDDILGLSVTDEATGETLGVVCDVEQYPANDVWHVKTAAGEVLIPNVPAVVKRVDLENGRVVIFKMKGLFEDAH